MARQFDGTNDSLISASTLDLSSYKTITFAFFFYSDAFVNDDDLAAEFGANWTLSGGRFIVDANSSDGTFLVGMNLGSLTYGGVTRPSAATWVRVVIELDASVNPQTIKVWFDGSPQSFTYALQGSATLFFFANDTLNLMCRNNASLFYAGRMCDVAIYNGTLSGGDLTALTTQSVATVGSPVFAWPICGTASPEPNSAGGIDLTVNGATSVTHPSQLTNGPCIVSFKPRTAFTMSQAVHRSSFW